MKKIILCVLVAILSLFAFAGCGESRTSYSDNSEKSEIVLNKKYILDKSLTLSGQSYYLFTTENEGVFSNSYYTVNFKYVIVEDSLHCFYDSIEFVDPENPGGSVKSVWTQTFWVSENFLLDLEGKYYLNEDFLKNELVNFGK